MMNRSSLILVCAALLLKSMGIFVVADHDITFEDQKNFFFPDPNAGTGTGTGTTPPVSYTTPPGEDYSTPPPGEDSTPPPPPSKRNGNGNGGGTPAPAHRSNPPSGGSNHHTTPSPPTHHSPPTRDATLTPPTPIFVTPPSPSDPTSPPYTCTYWKKHPTLVVAVFGWWGTVGSAFGMSVTKDVGAQGSLLQALSNTRGDGYGDLYREGTAALLNSMMSNTGKFPYTSAQVKNSFVAGLSSEQAASAQAQLFRIANQGTH